MFTGIVEEIGTATRVLKTEMGARLTIGANKVLDGTKLGDSINTNGVCLTVTGFDGHSFTVDAVAETLRRSNLGDMKSGTKINLERAMAIGDRLGGHIVQGHVDSTAVFISRVAEGDSWLYRFSFPDEIARYVVLKGSIAINGISLTVAGLGDDWFEIAIIPHTIAETNIGALKQGERVNLEADVLAKYVERLLNATRTQSTSKGLTSEQLEQLGY